MQGTIVMLMALSGLGCHHKSCDVTYVPSYYGTGACSSTAYAHDGCHAGGAVGCGSSRFPCHDCLLSGLFYCFGGWGGSWKGHCLFAGHHRGYGYDDGYYGGDYYSTSYSEYSPAVFGSRIPIYETPMTASQGTAAPSPSYAAPATPAPETPATAAPAAPPPPPPTPAPGASATPSPPVPAPLPGSFDPGSGRGQAQDLT
jgi:hypothetical protein